MKENNQAPKPTITPQHKDITISPYQTPNNSPVISSVRLQQLGVEKPNSRSFVERVTNVINHNDNLPNFK